MKKRSTRMQHRLTFSLNYASLGTHKYIQGREKVMRKGSFQSTMALLLSAGMLMSQCMTGVAAQSATYGEKYTKIEETSVIDESDVYYDVDGGLVYAKSADTACSEQLASFDGNDYVLEAPTDLKWISSNRISYQSNNLDHVVYYSTQVFCDGESVGKYFNGSFVIFQKR